MIRLMDASIAFIFRFLFGSGIDHLFVAFQALNMNSGMVLLTLSTLSLIPILGIGFYWITSHISRKVPLYLNLKQVILTCSILGCTLFVFELCAHPFLTHHTYSKHQNKLPLGTTFFTPKRDQIKLSNPFSPLRNEEITVKNIPDIKGSHLPNIYLFVIETFREDFLNSQSAPNLTAFASENIDFESSFSNANATHLSWFSIFHSNIPLHWKETKDHWKGGSIPLQYLKKLGYKVHVHSSADLKYFNMDQLIFGNSLQIVDHMENHSNLEIATFEKDALNMRSLKKDLKQEGHLYLIFLDSPHSEYSFPEEGPLPFEPICKKIDYLMIHPKSPDLEKIKNRYRNSIHYVDGLIGDFFATLKKNGLMESAIIAITGDHGEEFFEDGALFHSTHLNDYQTGVPIFLKFPDKSWTPQTKTATHLDLFPSILHYLTNQAEFSSLFDGESIFKKGRVPCRIAFAQKGCEKPTEFLIKNKNLEVHGNLIDNSTLEIIESIGLIDAQIFTTFCERAREDLLQRAEKAQ